MYVLSHYETMATGIALGSYDERVVYRAEYSKIKSIKDRLDPFIKTLRTEFYRDSLYKEFDAMVTLLDKFNDSKESHRIGKLDHWLKRSL